MKVRIDMTLDLTKPLQTEDGTPVRYVCMSDRHPTHMHVVLIGANTISDRMNVEGDTLNWDLRVINVPDRQVQVSAQHTPSPWHDDGYRIYAPTDSEDPRSGRIIVEYKHRDEFNRADAPLIAAAPDLLEALRMLANWADHNVADPALAGPLGYARAAIAKATGEQK